MTELQPFYEMYDKKRQENRKAYNGNKGRITGKACEIIPAKSVEKRNCKYDQKIPEYRRYKPDCGFLEEAACQIVNDKQGCKIYYRADQGMEAVRRQVSAVNIFSLEIKRNINCQNDAQAVDENGKKVRKSHASCHPAEFSRRPVKMVQEGKNEHGSGNDHKGNTRAGRGDHIFKAVVHITCAGFIKKGNAA